jgi:hypothetical protein
MSEGAVNMMTVCSANITTMKKIVMPVVAARQHIYMLDLGMHCRTDGAAAVNLPTTRVTASMHEGTAIFGLDGMTTAT